ncbi:hypothetical protein GR157_11215 [Burkholderia sp. 4701]|nr:hypothetical protein [Burkholderia sp. 4701]MXN82505.1 hypothetical protein [Burkholderia sp. 4812]
MTRPGTPEPLYTLGIDAAFQDGAACLAYPVRPARWGVSIAQQLKVFVDARRYRTHRVVYRPHNRAVPPWHDYAATLAALAFAGGRTAPATAWAAITGTFCLRWLPGALHFRVVFP